MTFQEFKKITNTNRKAGGKYGKWYTFIGNVDGKSVRLKCFKTWLQIYEVNGVDHSTTMDLNVGEMNKKLAEPFGG